MKMTDKNIKEKHENTYMAIKNLEREMQKYQEFFLKKREPGCVSFDEWLVTFRLSVIKCFELAIYTLWRYLKLYGEVFGGMVFENNSPKAIVRVCHHARIIDELEAEGLIFMIEGRNNTSHIYKEEIVQQIFCSIEKYYKIMKNIIERLKPSVEM